MENHGLVYEGIIPDAIPIGKVGAALEDIMPSGDWEPNLPEFENQSKLGLETMNCVQFSLLNVCETQARYYGKPLNLSDRFLYWASGCDQDGNTFARGYGGLKKYGAPAEEAWAWLKKMSRGEYGMEPPADVKAEALKLWDEWDLGKLRYVDSTIPALKDALKKRPIWWCNTGHAMEFYRVDDRLRVWDTYNGGKGSFPLDYTPEIRAAYIFSFQPKSKVIIAPVAHITLPENCYVTGVFPTGLQVALHVDGRLIIDDPGLVLSQWIARNEDPIAHRFNGGPTRTISATDWNAFERVNFKGEPWGE